jgi:hypothetical protein
VIGALSFLVVVLAAYRATRIVTTDSISAPFRERLYRWAWVEPTEPDAYSVAAGRVRLAGYAFDDASPLPREGGLRTYVSEVFQCSWCLGVWVSYVVAAVWWWGVRDGGPVVAFAVVGLAVAGGQGFLASRADA